MIRPAIKRVHGPCVLPGGRIRLGMEQYGVASEIVDDESAGLERLLTLMDGSREVDELWRDLRATHPEWELADVRDAVDELADAGHLEDLGAPLPPGLTAADAHRYRSARDFFAWIDPVRRDSPHDVQARIRRASVLLIGLGGTGTSVAMSLVATGIGRLHCVDFDRVEATNLTRQLLYTEADVGRLKTEAAVERLTARNSTVTVTAEDARIGSPADVGRLIAGHDVLVLCADEPADTIQLWVNEAALRTSTPWFIAAYTGAMTGVGSFVPGETGCWECVNRVADATSDRSAARWLFDTAPHAVVAASAAVCGHLCALDVLYRIGGLAPQTHGRIFQHNLARWDHQYFLDAVPDPSCPACGGAGR